MAFIIVAVTVTVAVLVEVRRRRALARAEQAARLAEIADVEMAAAPNLPAGSLTPARA